MSESGDNDGEDEKQEEQSINRSELAEEIEREAQDEDSETYSPLFDGVDDAERVPVEDSEEEKSGSSSLSEAIAAVVREEGLETIIETAGDVYRESKEDEREHNREILQQEMNYNLFIFGGLSAAVIVLTVFSTLNPVTALAYIAGLATGFGTHSTLSSLST